MFRTGQTYSVFPMHAILVKNNLTYITYIRLDSIHWASERNESSFWSYFHIMVYFEHSFHPNLELILNRGFEPKHYLGRFDIKYTIVDE